MQGSVSLAAERLQISQPAVTQNVQRFEKITGISLLSRGGKVDLSVAEAVRTTIYNAMICLDDLQFISGNGALSLPRLGLSDCVGRYLAAHKSLFEKIKQDFSIHIGRPAELAQLFVRGELDMVARPLFHFETEHPLTTQCQIVWVNAKHREPSLENVKGNAGKIHLIARSTACPFSWYINRQIAECSNKATVVGYVDDYCVALDLARQSDGYFPVPAFILQPMNLLESQIVAVEKLRTSVKFGIFHHNKRVPLRHVHDLFDRLEAIMGDRPYQLLGQKMHDPIPDETLPRKFA